MTGNLFGANTVVKLVSVRRRCVATAGDFAMPETTSFEPDFERQKWQSELELRKRELDLKEHEQHNRDVEIELRKAEQARSRWASPVAVAIFAAAIAAAGNAVVTGLNGKLQRDLETQKSQGELQVEKTKAESNRILELIKTDVEQAASNLDFLLKSGLVADADLKKNLQDFLDNRKHGSGPALPAPGGRLGFEESRELTRPLQEQLQTSFDEYFVYLDKIGFPPAKQKVNVKVGTLQGRAAYFSDNTIAVDQSMADDPSVAFNEYNHYILRLLWSKYETREWYGPIGALENGLADYFACSFLNNPNLGEESAKELGWKTPYLYTLAKSRAFGELAKLGPYHGGEVWGGALWEIRKQLARDVADPLIVSALTNFSPPAQDKEIPGAFVRMLLDQARNKDQHTFDTVSSVLRARRFPFPP